MARRLGWKAWILFLLFYTFNLQSELRAEPIAAPIAALAQVTQSLQARAEQLQNGDPINDLIQAVVTIANVLNATAPQLVQFMASTENFYPQAESFITDFHNLINNYGNSWFSFSNSFTQVVSIIERHAPETIPKLNDALDSINNITAIINQNSDPFMQSFTSASSSISGVANTKFLFGALAGAITVAWCLKYEQLGKYVFSLDPQQNILYRGATCCSQWASSGWSWAKNQASLRCFRTPSERESGSTDLELGIIDALDSPSGRDPETLVRRASTRQLDSLSFR